MVKVRKLLSIFCLSTILALGVLIFSAQALEDKNDSPSLSHYIMGVYREDTGELDGALSEYRKALSLDPNSSLLHLNLATVLIKKHSLDSAAVELRQSIALEPSAVEAHTLLALIYAAQDKNDLAQQEYTLALKNASELEPENIEIYRSLGVSYLQQKKFREAESIFKLIIGLSATDSEAHFFLGNIYYELKNYPQAEIELKTVLKLNPFDQEALNSLGYFYLEQDKLIDQAGAMIKRALALEPENGAYIDSLGWYYFKKKNFKQAKIEIERAAGLINDPAVYEHLGDVYLKLGDPGNAKLNWEKSLKLDSQQGKVKEKLLNLTTHAK